MKKWSECIKRALRTFIEAAAAYLAAHIVLAVSTGGEYLSVRRTALMWLAVSSVAAGLAVVLNMPKKAAEAENAASGGSTVSGSTPGGAPDAGLIEPDAAGGGQSMGDDVSDAAPDADNSASDTDTADLSSAAHTAPDAEGDADNSVTDAAVGEHMPDGAGNKGIL